VGASNRKVPGQLHPRSWDEAIGELAGRQHGVVSLAQLRELGLTRHQIEGRVAARRLLPLHRGVYAVGHEALTWRARLLAAVCACGPGALASHRAAGAIHRLISFSRIEVTVAHTARARRGIAVHRSRHTAAEDRTVVDAIPVTSVARTFVDLAEVLNERQLTRAVRQAELLKVFDLRAIEAALERVPGRRGRHRLRRALVAYQPESHFLRSRAERRLKALCMRYGLPKPQFNVQVCGHEVDAYWPEAKLALEFDGVETHYTRHAFHQDRRPDRALAAEGIQTLRVTWPDLDAALAEQVRRILARR
jgi:very-short-patch-repair endonuclease